MEVGASAGCPQWECVLLQPSTSRECCHDWGLAGDAQGAGPGSVPLHPAIVTVLFVCSDLLGPHHRDGAAPSLTGIFSIQSNTSQALKKTK